MKTSKSRLGLILGLFVILQINLVSVYGSKILMVTPLTTRSEKNLFIPLANALGARGHEVTILSRFKSSYESPNVREIIVLDYPTYMEQWENPLESRAMSARLMFEYDWTFNLDGCKMVYEHENFQKVRHPSVTFDLIITNSWFQQCLQGFLYKKKAPFIMLSTMGMNTYIEGLTGHRMPTSFVPSPLLSTSERMTFFERVFNTLGENYLTYAQYSQTDQLTEFYRKYEGPDVPDVAELDKQVSMIFQNTHFSVTPTRPQLPDVIDIAGTHCRDGKPLPKDLDDFLSQGPFIYFSIGSVIQSHKMSPEWKNIFINVFGRTNNTRFLWKYESDDLKNLPPNIRTGKWLPQQDILAHKNCKAFITHSGGFSTQETTYHGVPLITMPIYVDQNLNAKFAVARGYGIELEFLDLNEDILERSINEILTNKSYAENAKKMSALFRDQPQKPLDRAVYWTEYVIRHKGAGHLRSAARDLSFIAYYSIDVLGFFFAILAISLLITVKVVTCLVRLACCKRSKSKKVKKN